MAEILRLRPQIGYISDAVQAGETNCHMIRVGDLLFLSGLVGVTTDANDDVVLLAEDTRGQMTWAFEFLRRSLDAVGLSATDVVSVTMYATDIAEANAAADVVAEFFADAHPTATLIGVAALGWQELKYEVTAVAAFPSPTPALP